MNCLELFAYINRVWMEARLLQDSMLTSSQTAMSSPRQTWMKSFSATNGLLPSSSISYLGKPKHYFVRPLTWVAAKLVGVMRNWSAPNSYRAQLAIVSMAKNLPPSAPPVMKIIRHISRMTSWRSASEFLYTRKVDERTRTLSLVLRLYRLSANVGARLPQLQCVLLNRQTTAQRFLHRRHEQQISFNIDRAKLFATAVNQVLSSQTAGPSPAHRITHWHALDCFHAQSLLRRDQDATIPIVPQRHFVLLILLLRSVSKCPRKFLGEHFVNCSAGFTCERAKHPQQWYAYS